MSLFAEGVVKKRGRPRKNAVVGESNGDGNADVTLESESGAVVSSGLKTKTKTRGKGKIEAKKSASVAASSPPAPAQSPPSASTSTLTTPSPSPPSKRGPKSQVRDAGLADAVDESNPAATRTAAVKAVAGSKSRGKATSRSLGVKKQESVSPDVKKQESELVSVRDSTPPRRNTSKGETRVENAAVVSPSPSSSLQGEGTAPAIQPETSNPSQTSSRDISISISKILQQAKAFSTHSTQLQQGILAFVDERETERECEALISPSWTQPSADVEIQVSAAPPMTIAGSLPSTVPAIDIAIEHQSLSSTATHSPPSPLASQSQPQQPPPSPQPLSLGTMPLPPIQFKGTTAAAAAATGFAGHIRAYSSTSPLPMSTTVALAARGQSRTNLPPAPPRRTAPTTTAPAPEPRHPLPFTPPSAAVPIGPRPPKLSEMPLEQRKKDPRYRKATVRYTAAIVALPFAIVTSYLLWEKYQEHQIYLQRVREARAAADTTVTTAANTTRGGPSVGGGSASGLLERGVPRGSTPGRQDRE
ncbi:hypothetical protein A1O7_01791 [Cladophialophora yegresii CBS 114405]|uniref:Uncharacterized protein n=1 Tax=Cladophialophora yegresii CBS 114405 TaxID=1182544 RepID=W9WKD1_9EURO|nr:uncharacterized protein A1O7_01791 [Cladophialophora yegresii CBS 114405]EXJ65450.1 hypothetical protein A1O7_01791 [Cladophialophora yegresii CBS 114405]